MASCGDCRSLFADLRAVSAVAASDLPRPVRPRDFRITPEQARHSRGSIFTRFLERLAAPGLGILQPVGGLAAALGLALIVLNGPLLGGMSAGAALPANDSAVSATAGGLPGAAPMASASGIIGRASEGYSGTGSSPAATIIATPPPDMAGAGPTFTAAPSDQRETLRALDADAGSRTPVPVPMLAGVVLLGGGLLMVALRVLARRRLTE